MDSTLPNDVSILKKLFFRQAREKQLLELENQKLREKLQESKISNLEQMQKSQSIFQQDVQSSKFQVHQTLRNQVTQLEKQQEMKDLQLKQYKDQISDLEQLNQQAIDRIEQIEQEILKPKIDQFTQNLSNIMNIPFSLESQQENQLEIAKRLTKYLNFEQENSNLRQKMNEILTQNEELMQKVKLQKGVEVIEFMEKQLKEMENIIIIKDETSKQKQEEINEMKLKNSKLMEQNQELQAITQEQELKIHLFEETINENLNLKDKNQEQNQNIQLLQKQIQEKQNKIDELQNKIIVFQQENNEKHLKLLDLQNQKQIVEEKYKKLNVEFEQKLKQSGLYEQHIYDQQIQQNKTETQKQIQQENSLQSSQKSNIQRAKSQILNAQSKYAQQVTKSPQKIISDYKIDLRKSALSPQKQTVKKQEEQQQPVNIPVIDNQKSKQTTQDQQKRDDLMKKTHPTNEQLIPLDQPLSATLPTQNFKHQANPITQSLVLKHDDTSIQDLLLNDFNKINQLLTTIHKSPKQQSPAQIQKFSPQNIKQIVKPEIFNLENATAEQREDGTQQDNNILIEMQKQNEQNIKQNQLPIENQNQNLIDLDQDQAPQVFDRDQEENDLKSLYLILNQKQKVFEKQTTKSHLKSQNLRSKMMDLIGKM